MAISANTIIKKVRDLVGDQDDVRHPDDELLEYLNEAQRAAVLIRPEVNPVTAILTTETEEEATAPVVNALVEYNIKWGGLRVGTRQVIPDKGYVFISAIRNLERMTDDDGTRLVPKRAATPTDQENLDQADPEWHTDININVEGDENTVIVNVIQNFVYDIRNRIVFYNYPYVLQAQDADADEGLPYIPHCYLEIIYATVPDDIAAIGDNITVDDVYEPALVNYMLHRACGKDPASVEDVQKSMGYLTNFTTLITGNADQKELELVVRHSPAEGARGG